MNVPFNVIVSCLLVIGFTVGCQELPTAHQPKTKLVITGSSTLAPLVAEVGKRFEARYPNFRVDVQTGGSSRGIADIRKGLADIGMVSRALFDDERDLYGHTLAHDGVSLIVHRSNPVRALQNTQVVAIYTGTITNWKEVGGIDAPITVVNKAEGRATLDLFLNYFQLTNRHIKAQVVIGDNEHGIKTVAGNPHAIAYVSIGTAEYDAAQGVPIALVSLNGIPASLPSVQREDFPLTRPLVLVTNTAPTGLSKTFIQFATSQEVHDLVTRHFFVPVSG